MAYKNYIKVYNIDGCSYTERGLLSFLINQPRDNSLFWKKNYLEHLLDVGRKELNAIIQHLTELGLLETKSYRNKGTQFKLLGEAKETRDMLLNKESGVKNKVRAKPKNQPQPKANNNDDEKKKKPKYVEYSKKDLGEITEEFGITCLC